ncbi:MAG: acyl-CoA synthetase FdrA [Bacteroidetes bacterium]|nr:acyl-CoA synthetase FdrA [Bacteroidota bacterium]
MIIKGIAKKGAYYDSVTLMIVSKKLNEIEGVIDSSVVMGTNENKAILNSAGLLIPEFEALNDTDLLISIKANTETVADEAISKVSDILKELLKKQENNTASVLHSLDQAVEQLPEANLCLISIAGKYAAKEAKKALDKNLHVMIFSDNVSIEDELDLKKIAKEKGLLLMGPDCGTAIINGVPLAFANVVNKGDIGIVAASGTGLQEVSSIISNNGAGISQAIGTGGRDVKKEIGGIMFIEALRALNNDEETNCIVLISKPPHPEVLDKIAAEIKNIKKPVVGIFIGGNPDVIAKAGAIPAANLEEAALIAVSISKGKNIDHAKEMLDNREKETANLAEKLSKKIRGKYVRGLFSGGTLCDEAQLILKDTIGFVYSNTPLNEDFKLDNLWKSKEHTILDLGDDEFTSGRPHPMIDFSLRNKRIAEEAADNEVAIILFDVVLGYGSHISPAAELVPVIKNATKTAPNLLFICSVTGTDGDPQNRKEVIKQLESAGVIVMPSNVAAAKLVSKIVNK